MWRAAKASGVAPFPGSPCDWDINKQRLVYWTALYESVYNSVDRPPQWVIEDDELLDRWLEEETRELEERAEQEYKKKKKKMKDGNIASNSELVITIDRSEWRYNPRPANS